MALAAGCTTASRGGLPGSLRGYEILIEGGDSLSQELASALGREGFTVRRGLRGGGPPTAALLVFTMREAAPDGGGSLYARLADTRRGRIVAAVAVPLDSLQPDPRSRALALVRALLTVTP